MARYDLHTHSNRSDGLLPPAEVVRRARDASLDGIALTDHDTTSGIEEATAAGAELGVEVLLGCEVSAGWRGGPVHMLAYFVDPTYPAWVEELRWIVDDREVRAEKMVDRLNELGSPVTMEQVLRIANGASIGRPHIAAAMVEAGTVGTTLEAFTEEWIADGGRAYIPKRVMSPQDTVTLVTNAGGVSVMAHPVWIERDGRGNSAELIAECAALGMAGVEVNHPDHDADERARLSALADQHGLLITGSSDFHGNKHGGSIGENTTDADVVQALRDACKPVSAGVSPTARGTARDQAG